MDLPSCAIEHEEDPTAELVKAAAASPKPSVLLMMNPHYACSHWSDWTSHAVLAALRAARRRATEDVGSAGHATEFPRFSRCLARHENQPRQCQNRDGPRPLRALLIKRCTRFSQMSCL
jgi:hypothetical protein